jgi:putative ABC transport system permease protein
MKKANLGMELSGCVAIRSPGTVDSTYHDRLKAFKDRLLTSPFIKNVCSSSSIPGVQISKSGGVQRVIGPELDGNNVFFLQVDENFLNTYDIRLIAGRNFSDKTSGLPSVILNEAALQTLKFNSPEEALNHRIHWQLKEYVVIGVFANYNHLFLKETFEPIMLSFRPSTPGYLTLKIQGGHIEEALATAKQQLQSLFPSTPFEYSFLESTYNRQYQPVQQFESLAKYFSLLAITISCLGLFALSYYAVQKRTMEIAVRKVFGARSFDILLLLSKSYVRITLISGLMGSAFTFYLMNEWLQNFAFATTLDFFDFVIPFIFITSIVLTTVSYNCLRTFFINPSNSLKHN